MISLVKGASCIGRQVLKMDGEEGIKLDDVWFLNEKVQIDENGKQIPVLGGEALALKLFTGRTALKVDNRSTIHHPLESTNALNDLLTLMKAVLKHNFIQG